ncbi:DNA primase [Streptococcus pyogenes]|nr:DNA primase [Streptococcus pyogenes MGAS10750]EPZ48474.1 phage/plasmid primase, P4 family, C-terminal domain protein [Streptococcus pyogenes GA40634]QBX10752.1 DNA primase [Streptococcus satellite phage Javan475]QBX10934.1 DNA primase [Streptococcus satellite phage Javan504]SQF58331.1 DNA primase [Streptococcus pyogenes]
MNQLQEEHEEARGSEPPKNMGELYRLLSVLGHTWHEENKYIVNEGKKNQETKIPLPTVSYIANVFREHCYFTFIGKGEVTDISKLYMYHLDLGYYISSEDLFRKLLLRFDSRLTSRRWLNEVFDYIRTETTIRPAMEDYRYIPVANGVYNIQTKQLEPFSPKFIITSKIQTSYTSKARKPILGGWFDFDKWLSSLAVNDGEVVELLWQVMNEAINPNRTRKKLVIMVGDGNNGKGTFQALLENLIGRANISNLKPDQFGKEFYLSALDGKVCNIGDDISNKYLDEVSDLMSVASGDPVQVNRKGKDTYEATYRLMCIFSGNDLPKARNKTTGWYRRLCLIPFNADFNGEVERPEIKDQFMKDKQLLEWVLFKILNMEDFDKFIEPKAVREVIESYKKDNDYIRLWVTEYYIPNGWHEVNHVPMFVARNKLEEFAKDIGIDKPKLGNFGRYVISELEKETENQYSAKNGTTALEYYDLLDPLGFQRDRFVRGIWGIHLD